MLNAATVLVKAACVAETIVFVKVHVRFVGASVAATVMLVLSPNSLVAVGVEISSLVYIVRTTLSPSFA